MIGFHFKNGDVVSFPDTDSEYVDVGIGKMKVAEAPYDNLLIVRKHGRGFRLELEYECSEVFRIYPSKHKKRKRHISLQEFKNHFGDFSVLEYVCPEEDLRMSAEKLEEKYDL